MRKSEGNLRPTEKKFARELLEIHGINVMFPTFVKSDFFSIRPIRFFGMGQ